MAENRSGIFRIEALRHYLEGRDNPSLPRLVSPPTFLFMWLLLLLLVAAALTAMIAEVPIYSPAAVVVTENPLDLEHSPHKPHLVVFLPGQEWPRLELGNRVSIRINGGSERLVGSITAIEPQLINPKAAEKRFNLGAAAASRLDEPKAVAFVEFDPPGELLRSSYLGSVYDAEVETGRRRLISLFPVIGSLFK